MSNTPQSLHPMFPNMPFKGSYGVRETARGTGIPRRTLYRAIELGQITAIRLGKRGLRIPATALADFINSHTEDPNNGARWTLTQTRLDIDP